MIINGINYEENIRFEDNPLIFTASENVELQANFELDYIITEHVVGSGTISHTLDSGNAIFTATPNTHNAFVKYVVNDTEYFDNPLTIPYDQDLDVTAYFEYIGKSYTYSSGPNGYVISSLPSDTYDLGTEITLTATPIEHYHFKGWYVNDELTTTDNPYTFTLLSDTDIVGEFEEDGQYDINVSSNIKGTNVYQSATKVYEGEDVTLRARQVVGYNFVKWSNGSTNNPLVIEVHEDINIEAIYSPIVTDSTIYDWHCYIKDQTAMNTLPKALLRVVSFKIKNDLLTTANSSIEVLDVPSDVNLGDILCLYNPKGIVRYYGIIKSINDKTIQCSQMQTLYKGKWLQDNDSTKTTIESEFAYLLEQFAHGYMKGSTYQDTLQYQEKAPLLIKTDSATSGNLTTAEKENNVVDMETYIYQLYQDYQILLEFNIPYGEWDIDDEGGGSVTIKKPNYSSIKIGDNTNAIFDISPTTETEKTNKLIIYDKDGTYRTTYVTTTNGIVEEPSSIVGRFEDIDTKIVFSDDPLEDIVKANLSVDMFNHKISFTLLLDNNLYKFDDFKLGMPVEVWNGVDYYNSVITGYEMNKAENQNVIEAKFTCGFVRTTLTKLLSRKLGVI